MVLQAVEQFIVDYVKECNIEIFHGNKGGFCGSDNRRFIMIYAKQIDYRESQLLFTITLARNAVHTMFGDYILFSDPDLFEKTKILIKEIVDGKYN